MKLAIPAFLAFSIAAPAAAQYGQPSPPRLSDALRPMPQSITQQASEPVAQPAADAPAISGEQELVNMEEAWSKALVANDSAALNRIIAPDWHGQNQEGGYYDRASMLKSFADGTDRITAMANHDVHVRFVGADLAIVQGKDTETSTHKGKPSSGVYSWTDIFQKRNGRWVAIASQNTPVAPQK
jgi:uncharacterized protein (TIGR02246 family)